MAFPSLALIAVLGSQGQTAGPITLSHSFQKGEKIAYKILSHIQAKDRGKGLDTWIPQDFDFNYNFTATVTDMKGDGVAVVRYQRPTITEIEGETFEAAPKTIVNDVDFDYQLSLSPINEVLEEKDLSTKKEKKPVEDNGGGDGDRLMYAGGAQGAMGFFAPYIADIHRLSLFIGGIDDSLDFAPKLPLNAVKVGDSWKRTVGFQPQKLKGKDGKVAVQRLDYTFTYMGPVQSDGATVLRIEAKLNFSTDLAEYFKQLLQDRANETNVVKIPLKFTSTIDFDLDPATRDTIKAMGTTSGGYQVYLTQTGSDPAAEEKFEGSTTMTRTGKRIVK